MDLASPLLVVLFLSGGHLVEGLILRKLKTNFSILLALYLTLLSRPILYASHQVAFELALLQSCYLFPISLKMIKNCKKFYQKREKHNCSKSPLYQIGFNIHT